MYNNPFFTKINQIRNAACTQTNEIVFILEYNCQLLVFLHWDLYYMFSLHHQLCDNISA